MKTRSSFEGLGAICQSTRHLISDGKIFVNSSESIKKCEQRVLISLCRMNFNLMLLVKDGMAAAVSICHEGELLAMF